MHFKLRISLKSYKIGGKISVRALALLCVCYARVRYITIM